MRRPTFLELAPATAGIRSPLLLHCPDAALLGEADAPGYWTGVLLALGRRFLLVRFCADVEGVALDVAGPVESLAALEGALGQAQLREGPGMHREYVTDMKAIRAARLAEPQPRGVLRELHKVPSTSPVLRGAVTLHMPGIEPLGEAAQHGSPGFVSVVAQGAGVFALARFAYAPFSAHSQATLDLALAPGLSQLGASASRACARDKGAGSRRLYATDREAIGKAERLLQRRARGLSDEEEAPNLGSKIHTEVR